MIYYNGITYRDMKANDYSRLLKYFERHKKPKGSVSLVTCNRIELYSDNPFTIKGFNHKKGKSAILHLFKVAAGIDSMILGENEISVQVKQALLNSRCSKELLFIFERALKTAKKIRAKTKINYGRVSIHSMAVEYVVERFKPKKVMVIGTGMLGGKIAKALSRKKLDEIIVSSYRKHRAKKLAAKIGCEFIDFREFGNAVKGVDAIFSATACPVQVIHKEQIPGNKLVIVDLAVPYDVDRRIDKMENVVVIRLSYFKDMINENKRKKKKEVKKAMEIIYNELKIF